MNSIGIERNLQRLKKTWQDLEEEVESLYAERRQNEHVLAEMSKMSIIYGQRLEDQRRLVSDLQSQKWTSTVALKQFQDELEANSAATVKETARKLQLEQSLVAAKTIIDLENCQMLDFQKKIGLGSKAKTESLALSTEHLSSMHLQMKDLQLARVEQQQQIEQSSRSIRELEVLNFKASETASRLQMQLATKHQQLSDAQKALTRAGLPSEEFQAIQRQCQALECTLDQISRQTDVDQTLLYEKQVDLHNQQSEKSRLNDSIRELRARNLHKQ